MKSMRLIWGSTFQTFIKCSLFSKITGVKMSKVCNLRRFFNLLGGPRSFDLNSVKRFYTTMVVTGASLCCLFSAGLCCWCFYVVWYCACVVLCLCGSLSLSHVWRSSKVAPHSISLFATHCPCSLCSLHPAAHLLHLLLLLFLFCSNKHVQVVAIQPLEWISCYHLFHNFGGSFFVFSPFQLPVNLSRKGFRIKHHTFDQNGNSPHHHCHHHQHHRGRHHQHHSHPHHHHHN